MRLLQFIKLVCFLSSLLRKVEIYHLKLNQIFFVSCLQVNMISGHRRSISYQSQYFLFLVLRAQCQRGKSRQEKSDQSQVFPLDDRHILLYVPIYFKSSFFSNFILLIYFSIWYNHTAKSVLLLREACASHQQPGLCFTFLTDDN